MPVPLSVLRAELSLTTLCAALSFFVKQRRYISSQLSKQLESPPRNASTWRAAKHAVSTRTYLVAHRTQRRLAWDLFAWIPLSIHHTPSYQAIIIGSRNPTVQGQMSLITQICRGYPSNWPVLSKGPVLPP